MVDSKCSAPSATRHWNQNASPRSTIPLRTQEYFNQPSLISPQHTSLPMTQLNPQETANEQKVAHQEVEIQEMATGQEEASENQAAVGNQEERDGQEAEAQYEAKTPEPEVVTWGRISDLRLLVNEKTPEGPVPKVFAVSSHAISMACDAWYSMLNGGFKEAQQQSSAVREVALPEDDTEALTVLLDIAHLRFDRVPLQLEFELLLKITVLTDKYAATRLVKPWAYRWIERCEYYAGCKAQWLWVAWELGHVGIFADIVRTLVMTVSVGPEGECVNEDGSILDPKSSSQHLPPDIIGEHAPPPGLQCGPGWNADWN